MEILLHERIISLVAEKRKVRRREKEGRAIMYSCLIIGISSKSGAKDRHLCGYKEEIIYI